MIARTAVVSQAECSDTKHLLVETGVCGPLQRRMSCRISVKCVGADEMRRRSDRRNVGELRRRSSMTLELRLSPVANLTWKKRSFGS